MSAATDIPISGQLADGFEPVADAFRQNFADGQELGAAFSVWRGTECLVDLVGGWADRGKSVPWQADTLVPVFSTTKPIAALVAARVIERAGLSYETPVAEIWPAFAVNGKEATRLGHVLSHQAGLPGFVDPIDPDLWLDPPALSEALADLAPMWTPGDGSGYHPLTWGYLVGEIVRRIDGRSLGTILREDITHAAGHAPIDFWIGLPASEHHRVADMQRPTAYPELGDLNAFKTAAFLTKWAAPNRGGAQWREIEIPSANGHGTATATARLYGFFAGVLSVAGRQVLEAEDTRAAMLESRSHGDDRVLPFTIDFAAGVMRNSQQVYGPNRNSYGHSGWGGSMAFGDPDAGISAAYVMNRQSNILQGDPRATRLIDAVYRCL